MTGSREARTRRRPAGRRLPLPLRGETSHDPVYITPIYNMNYCRELSNELVSESTRMFCLGSRDVVSLAGARIAENHFCHGWLSLLSGKWLLSDCVCQNKKALNKRIWKDNYSDSGISEISETVVVIYLCYSDSARRRGSLCVYLALHSNAFHKFIWRE